MAVFKENINAVQAAIKILPEINRKNETLEEKWKIDLRIGISFGETMVNESGDRTGLCADIASRIEGIKRDSFKELDISENEFPLKNRIFISHHVYDDVKNIIKCVKVGMAKLKGIEGEHHDIYLVDWHNS